MAKSLKLGADLALPLNVVTEKLAFLGRTGSGKTYAAMKLAELMLEAGAQVGAIDPVGVWRALRVPAKKGGPSFDVVVFGGLYGDLPLVHTAGAVIADLICDRGISFVLDVSQFIPSEQQRFVREFADRFFQRRKAAPAAVHLFLEECQEFIPENPSGEEAKTLGVMQRLWKLGRNFGIGGSLISQRPQEIAKKALNMSGTLFALQMTGPQERKTIRAWVADHGVSADIESVLQKLERGHAHVESPTFLGISRQVRILPRVTADLSSTPEVGAAGVAKRDLTPIDVAQLQAAMAETIEQAKADDPRELRRALAAKDREIAELRRASNQGPKQEVPALTSADRERIDALLGMTRRLIEDRTPLLRYVAEEIKSLTAAAFDAATLDQQRLRADFVRAIEKAGLQRILQKLDRVAAPAPKHPNAEPCVRTGTGPAGQAVPARPPGRSGNGARPAGGVEQRILNALAELEALGAKAPQRELVALLAGYTHLQSKGFVNAVSALRTSGRVEYPSSDTMTLTAEGRQQAVAPARPQTPAEVQARICAILGGKSAQILQPVIDAYPNPLPRAEVAAAAGYGHLQSKGFVNAISRLRTLGFVDYPSSSTIVATPVLFLERR